MYRIKPNLYIRIRCEGEWNGTIQELYEIDAKAFDSKNGLAKLIYEYASQELIFDEIAWHIKAEGFKEIEVEAQLKRSSIGCLVEIYGSQHNTCQGIFRSKDVVRCFKNDSELFSLMEKAYSQVFGEKMKSRRYNGAKTKDRVLVAEYDR